MSVQQYKGYGGVEVRCYSVDEIEELRASEARLAAELVDLEHNLRHGYLDSQIGLEAQLLKIDTVLKNRPIPHLTRYD